MSTNRLPSILKPKLLIKTWLIVSAVITITLALLVALTVSLQYRNVGRAARTERFVHQVIKDVSDLNSLSYAYSLLKDKRPRVQWQLKYTSLGKLLSGNLATTPDEQALIVRLRSSHEQMKGLFNALVKITEENRLNTKNAASPYDELNEGIMVQLLARSETMAYDASLLGRESARHLDTVRWRSFFLVLVSAFILIVSAALTASFLAKGIGGSILRLEQGTRRIADGDLAYRVNTGGQDEIGHLAAAFNDMTAKLEISYFNLEQEIGERKQAQESIKRLNETLEQRIAERTLELQHLTESLEERVKERTQELAELSLRLVSAQEKERERVSYELHDKVWQNLVAIRFAVENLFSGQEDWAALQSKSKEVMAALLDTVGKIRSMQGDLWPYVLDDIGLAATLDWYCREFAKNHPGLVVKITDGIAETDIPPAAGIVIYRILQEVLDNAAKHSRADQVSIRFRSRDQGLEFAVEDNGVGFDPEEAIAQKAPWGGLGLLSIKARTELSGGTFEVVSAKGKGTAVQASWPSQKKG